MLNDQEQERFMRLWAESQPAVVNYIHATVRDPAAAKDLVGRGYTLEYAIPWKLLNAPQAPQSGDTLAMSWTAHWSDETGRLWRGQLVELRNASEPVRIHTWERAATWGKAVYR